MESDTPLAGIDLRIHLYNIMGPDFSFYKRKDERYIIDVKKELNANIIENIEIIGSNKIFKNGYFP